LATTSVTAYKTSFIKDFTELTKVKLSVYVLFSSIAGYLLAVDTVDFIDLLILCIGGYAMVGASNAFNQVIEKDLDSLMHRTKNRPVASGRMSVNTALTIATILTILGITLLYILNPKSAMFGAISIFSYVSLYTPLKTKTPLAVFVGAIPGAIPFMLGWVAATGNFGIEAGTLFMIQFFWQFPHFWAIGWFLYDDYKRGGFRMLPTGKKDKITVTQILLYSIWTIVCSILPVFGKTGDLHISIYTAVIVLLLGLWMLQKGIVLYKTRTSEDAKKLMLVSVSYISLLQIAYVIDKFIFN